jgi:hypothetical protein
VAPGLTQHVTEMSTRNRPKGKERPAHKADNLTANVSRLSSKCGSLDVSQACVPPVTGTAVPLIRTCSNKALKYGRRTLKLWNKVYSCN